MADCYHHGVYGVLLIALTASIAAGQTREECESDMRACLEEEGVNATDLFRPCFTNAGCGDPMCIMTGLRNYVEEQCEVDNEDAIALIINKLRGTGSMGSFMGAGRRKREVTAEGGQECNWGMVGMCAMNVYGELMGEPLDMMKMMSAFSGGNIKDVIKQKAQALMDKMEENCTATVASFPDRAECPTILTDPLSESEEAEIEESRAETKSKMCECVGKARETDVQYELQLGCPDGVPNYITRRVNKGLNIIKSDVCSPSSTDD